MQYSNLSVFYHAVVEKMKIDGTVNLFKRCVVKTALWLMHQGSAGLVLFNTYVKNYNADCFFVRLEKLKIKVLEYGI